LLDHDEKVAKDTKKRVSAEYEAQKAQAEAEKQEEQRRQRGKENTTPPREHSTTATNTSEDRRHNQWGAGNSQHWRDNDGYGEPSGGW